ncbi:beta-lactamase class A [Devosia sp. UYZn731]
MEPELNQGTPSDPRDTTTPRAFATTLHAPIFGDALPAQKKRAMLTTWMRSNEVGGPLLRAGVPKDWIVAARTGAGSNGTRGIVAVMWPGQPDPIVAAIFLTETTASMDQRNAAIAKLGRIIAEAVSKQ